MMKITQDTLDEYKQLKQDIATSSSKRDKILKHFNGEWTNSSFGDSLTSPGGAQFAFISIAKGVNGTHPVYSCLPWQIYLEEMIQIVVEDEPRLIIVHYTGTSAEKSSFIVYEE